MIYCEFCGSPSEYMTARQAARALGLSARTVIKYIHQGRFGANVDKVNGVHTNGEWRIPTSAVLPLMEANDEALYLS